PRRLLIAHRPDGMRSWPDKRDTRIDARLRKCLPFGKESVARMNCIGPRFTRHVNDFVDYQVALPWWWWPNVIGFISITHMQRRPIRIAVHCHGWNAQFTARPDHPHGNLSPVRN